MKTKQFDWPQISCSQCQKTFLGALYEGQPNDVCYKCYLGPQKKYPKLWSQLKHSYSQAQASFIFTAILTLREEGYLKFYEK